MIASSAVILHIPMAIATKQAAASAWTLMGGGMIMHEQMHGNVIHYSLWVTYILRTGTYLIALQGKRGSFMFADPSSPTHTQTHEAPGVYRVEHELSGCCKMASSSATANVFKPSKRITGWGNDVW